MKSRVLILHVAIMTTVFFVVLAFASLFYGMGYWGKADVTMTYLGGSYGTYLCNGSVQVSFSPFLYPISHMAGDSSISEQFQTAYDSVSAGSYSGRHYYEMNGSASNIGRLPDINEVKDEAVLSLVFPEFLKNLPYYFGASLAAAITVEILYRRYSGRSQHGNATENLVEKATGSLD
jgi:hypothetical protein